MRLKVENVKTFDISKQIKRSRSPIYEILSKRDNAIEKQRSDPPRKTSLRLNRQVLQEVSIQKKPVRKIAGTLVFPIMKSTVKSNIQATKIHKYRRMCRTPMMKEHNRKAHILSS